MSCRSPAEPLVIELDPVPAVMTAVRAVRDWPDVILFDSALTHPQWGRYSFLTADPARQVRLTTAVWGCDPFAELRRLSSEVAWERRGDLPPFQGGWAGVMSYELGSCWERVPPARHDEFQLPVLSAGWYDWVLAWDHLAGRAWLIAQPGSDHDPRQRVAAVMERLADPCAPHLGKITAMDPTAPSIPGGSARLPLSALSPQWKVPQSDHLWSNFPADAYLRALERVIEYIRAGDIFQANLTQRLLTPARTDPLTLYERLRTRNPAPMAGLYLARDWALLSASPERFVRIVGQTVSTRPIKGTRRRAAQPDADLFVKDALRESAKDQAENVMIVDLLRNDLSRVCRPGTVRVPQLCGVETFATVQHLVSEICGDLQPGLTAWDVFRATLPGGSITGAPKVRAMEIIAELEPTVRGPYTGSLFYVAADGRTDSNLLIRTFVQRYGWLQCGVGGGVTAQSVPADEYEETWHKAAGMLRALE
jgi:para-aminobenzoate synthetase component 1